MTLPRFGCYVLLAALASIAAAQEKTEQVSANKGLSEAKREFDAIKGSRSTLEGQPGNLPKVSAPALHLGAEEGAEIFQPESTREKEREKKKAAKAKNWLVDAMEKKPERNAGESKPAEAFKAESEQDEPSLLSTRPEPTERDPAKSAKADPRDTAAAGNPLTNYMAAWMTPKDYELLQVKPTETAVKTPESFGVRGTQTWDAGSAPPASATERLTIPASAAAAPLSNPYLSDFQALTPPPTQNSLAMPSNSGNTLAPPTVAPPPARNDYVPPKTEPFGPDALKPSNDAKYFPQLKRF